MSNLFVTGASGKLGRRVIELLLAAGEKSVVAGTRDPSKLSDLAAKGVAVRKVDFDDAATLSAAFAGVDRLLIVSTDALDRPGRRGEQHLRAVEAAKKAGVKHIVYTSLANPVGSAVTLAPDHVLTERALAESGVAHTVLRNALYAENLLGSLPGALASGKLVTAQGTGAAAYVTREDCARAAAAALTSTFSGSRTLEITGPAVVSGDEIARLASQVTGRPLVHTAIPADDLRQGLLGYGLPAPIADLVVSFDVAIANGEYQGVSPAVADLTGRAPAHLSDWLTANRAAFTA